MFPAGIVAETILTSVGYGDRSEKNVDMSFESGANACGSVIC